MVTTRSQRARAVYSEEKSLLVSFKYRRSLIVTLRFQPRHVTTLKYRKVRGRYAIIPFSYRTNNRRFRFGHNPFWHRGSQWPTPAVCQDVFDKLANFHYVAEGLVAPLTADAAPLNRDIDLERPTHAQIGICVDSVIKVIFSQSTVNDLALRQHKELCKTFTYEVDGKKVSGTIPNYHKIRTLSQEELEKHLKVGGLYKIRAECILHILNTIHATNCEKWGISTDTPSENQLGAKDFVPGLLSMDYLNGMCKEKLMDYLINWKNIGVKTAACILAFNFRMPVFAVDIHVHHMCRQLGWIPEDCDSADQACMFLDKFIPDNLKYGLHQIFWHHRQKCLRCKFISSDKRRPEKWEEAECPIESLCNRDIVPLVKRNAKRRIEQVESDDENDDDDNQVNIDIAASDHHDDNNEAKTRSNLSGKTTTRRTRKRPTKKLQVTQVTQEVSVKTTTVRTVKTIKTKKVTTALASMSPEKATQNGYVLIVETRDDDFGVSGRTSKNLAWKLAEHAEGEDTITIDEAHEKGLIKEGTWKKPSRAKKAKKVTKAGKE